MQGATSSYLKPPKSLIIDDNVGSKWKEWLQQYEWFAIATNLETKSPEVQVATFMMSIGPEAATIYNTFDLTDEESKDIKIIKGKFDKVFTPRKNLTYERYLLNKMSQSEGESFNEFLTKLKIQIKKCEYGTLADSILVDRIIIGIKEEELRKKLLATEDLTVIKAVDIAKIAELATKHVKNMQESEKDVTTVQSKARNKKHDPTETFKCKRCGSTHARKSCPAFNKKCNKCAKMGHFEQVCRSKKVSALNTTEDISENESNDEDAFVHEIKNKIDNDNWMESIQIGNDKMQMKLDTGAQCNVLPKRSIPAYIKKMQNSSVKNLVTFSKHKMRVIGEVDISCKVKQKWVKINFKIVDEDVVPIIGRKTCEALQLIKRVNEVNTETELGCLNNYEYDIDLKENPTFEIKPPRRIPHSIRQSVKDEIENMEKMGVIKRIHEATPVVSPMVIVHQKNKLRVCIDPTDVNKNIMRRHYPLRTIDEILAKIHGSKYFTLLDCKRGFWQIKVTERTQKYLTFSTPWGRYCCLRLPFGLASAPEVFTDLMETVLQGLENVECAVDDILIHAKTKEELQALEKEVRRRIEKAGLKLNNDKCISNQREVKFLGHILSEKGVRVDPDKVGAIQRLATPTNKSELLRFLGMVTYVGKFIKDLSDITEPLRALLKNDTEWIWDVEQEKAYRDLQKQLTQAPVLRYYNPAEPVKLSVDASSKAMGAVLMQNDQPIAYASRALTQSQIKYPQIEKEALAIKFGCKKFHEYVYGKKLTIESDHKPLEAIFKKPLHNAPPRLQRLLFDVIQYSPEIVYTKGKEMFIADTLSRDCINDTEKDDLDLEIEVHIVLAMTKDARIRIRENTEKDEELKLLKNIILEGFPDKQHQMPASIRKYWTYREELTTYRGLLFKQDQVFIPKVEQKDILKQMHEGHLGIQSCLKRARNAVYWHGMNKDLIDYVEKCGVCQRTQRSPTKETIIIKQIPDLPWQIVATDLFTVNNKEYIGICDSYSGYFDFEQLKSTTSAEVIEKLKKWFSVHGIPETLESDNGPQYSSTEFKKFAEKYNFRHQTSSPHFPRSNGLAERYVQTSKNLIKKCIIDKTDIYLALLNYRNVPRTKDIGSPVQRLMSRTTKQTLPIAKKKLRPKLITNVKSELTDLRKQIKEYADRGAKEAPKFEVGDQVRIQSDKQNWQEATIRDEAEKPRSYIVQTKNGKEYRRNTAHIRQTKASIPGNIQPPDISQKEDRDELEEQMLQKMQTTESNKIENTTEKMSRYGRIIKPVIRLDL